MKKWKILVKGILLENPVLVLVLGTCPTLAMTTGVISAVGMGLSALAVLICSNVAISALHKIIPDKVRIPAYIVLIAGFVTAIQMLIHAYIPSLYDMLGVYLPLITVNCIILGRAEMFANKNTVGDSALDAIGMGLGFTLTLFVMALIRETLGKGTFCDIEIPFLCDHHISILAEAPGGFFVFGVMIALVALITKGKYPKKKNFSCEGCPSAQICGHHPEEPACEIAPKSEVSDL